MNEYVVHEGRLYESEIERDAERFTCHLLGRFDDGGGLLGTMTLDDDGRVAVEAGDVPAEVFGWWCATVGRELELDLAGLVPHPRRDTDGRG